MTTMKELVELGKQQGFLEYSVLVQVLRDEVGLMQDQIEDMVEVFENLGVNITGKPNDEKGNI